MKLVVGTRGSNLALVQTNWVVDQLKKENPGVEFEVKIIKTKGDLIKELKKEAKKSKKVYLATDPDREGEAISWHLAYILGLDQNDECRIEFNEITKDAIKKAIKSPRNIDINLVDAQQARRVLDRLLGYQISPILWQKVRKGLSAGRVQSVTTKLICDREKEIEAFIPDEYWTIDVEAKTSKDEDISLKFYGRSKDKMELPNEEIVNSILDDIKDKEIVVNSIEARTRRKSAPKPFTTSMLQQEAANRLSFTTKKTMSIAQELYEGIDIENEGTVGLISYIRTDSKRISEEAKEKSKEYILEALGEDYYKPDFDKGKEKGSKKVQDAHEAIRPTSVIRTPDSIKSSLTKDQFKLYNLIWRRFIASQMQDSIFDILNVECKINDYILKATGSKMKFDGYTKASLVKTLEELGIGRPSTYAPTITTILNREYVEKQGSSLHPTELGKIVTDILETNFQKFIDVDFTATMESQLDEVEEGNIPWKEVVAKSYEPLKEAIEIAKENIEKINMDEETDEICENCGEHMVIKHGRFGKFMACKNYPECKTTKPIVNKIGVKCPKCNNGDIILRKSKKGKAFYGCSNYPECDFLSWNKPTGDICDKCGSYMVEKITKSETKVVCPNKECKNEMVKENSEN